MVKYTRLYVLYLINLGRSPPGSSLHNIILLSHQCGLLTIVIYNEYISIIEYETGIWQTVYPLILNRGTYRSIKVNRRGVMAYKEIEKVTNINKDNLKFHGGNQ